MTDFFDLPIRRIAANGIEIAARTEGSGPPMLLLHGIRRPTPSGTAYGRN